MWRNATQALVDQAHDQITKLLTSEWLVSDVEDDGGELNKCTRLAFNELTVFSR
jgi:nuclear pore complex protein Nup107